MKSIQPLWMVIVLFLLAGCSATGARFSDTTDKAPAINRDAAVKPASVANSLPKHAEPATLVSERPTGGKAQSEKLVIQTIDFRPGISSSTVERLAKRFGCEGSKGAGLITEKGPVEVYRMRCNNGMTFLAQCELRQCRPLR